jgi:hypothetical protein
MGAREDIQQHFDRQYVRDVADDSKRAWDNWTDEDRDHELAMIRELSETGFMDEALKMLGSFAKYVQREAPHLSAELAQLAVRWASEKGIPLDKLMSSMQEAE